MSYLLSLPPAPPTAITISVRGGNSYIYKTDVLIPILKPENTTFTLACNTHSRGDVTANYHYSWAFRGNPVSLPVFHQEDNILTINSTSPWNVVGAVQCFVRNNAGSISTGIRILPQGIVSLVPRLRDFSPPPYYKRRKAQ